MSKNYDVFISYSHSDGADYAEAIQRELNARGFSVFRDAQLLTATAGLRDSIREEVDRSDAVLILLTASAARSAWVREEVAVALRRNKRVIPVFLDESAHESAFSSLLADRVGLELADEPPHRVATKVSDTLKITFGAELRQRRLRRKLSVTLVTLMILLSLAAISAFEAARARRALAEARRNADLLSQQNVGPLRAAGGAPGRKLGALVLVGVDLSGLNFEGASLSRALLVDSDLSDANLTGADLSRSNLSSAILRRIQANSANFRSAYLVGCDLTDAILTDATLESADLRYVNLSHADLRGAMVEGARFEGATFDQNTQFPNGFDPSANGMVSTDNAN